MANRVQEETLIIIDIQNSVLGMDQFSVMFFGFHLFTLVLTLSMVDFSSFLVDFPVALLH